MNYFDFLVQNIPQIVNSRGQVFQVMGENMLHGIIILLIIWMGAQTFWGAISGSKIVSTFVLIIITSTLLTYYSAPLPALGMSIRELITNQAAAMTKMISSAEVDQVHTQFTAIEEKISAPSLFDVAGVVQYLLMMLLLIAARALTLYAVAYGFLATATVGIFGPFFIPFLLVPGMDWMFWGWLKALIQYAAYPVVANAYTLIGGQVILAFCREQNVGSSDVELSQIFVPLMVVFVIYCYGILKIPSLVSSMFSGRSGETAGPILR